MTTSQVKAARTSEASSTTKGAVIARWIIAGPLALLTSVLVMAGMSVWFPEGRSGIDHVAFPLILFPGIWALLFFYGLLEAKLWRAGMIMLIVGAANGVPVVNAVLAMQGA